MFYVKAYIDGDYLEALSLLSKYKVKFSVDMKLWGFLITVDTLQANGRLAEAAFQMNFRQTRPCGCGKEFCGHLTFSTYII